MYTNVEFKLTGQILGRMVMEVHQSMSTVVTELTACVSA
jgi:hypothetical protein